jgi:hypothetical protein
MDVSIIEIFVATTCAFISTRSVPIPGASTTEIIDLGSKLHANGRLATNACYPPATEVFSGCRVIATSARFYGRLI